jgi:hypothetical protein
MDFSVAGIGFGLASSLHHGERSQSTAPRQN